jgi:hypothetical protein
VGPLKVHLGGSVPQTVEVRPVPVERHLLERSAVRARLARLQHLRALLEPTDTAEQERLRREAISLSTRHRVLCDDTAMLVLEEDSDFATYQIDRSALADILVVGRQGIVRARRKGTIGFVRRKARQRIVESIRRSVEEANRSWYGGTMRGVTVASQCKGPIRPQLGDRRQ